VVRGAVRADCPDRVDRTRVINRFDPISTAVFAQQQGGGQQPAAPGGARGAVPVGAPGGGRGRGAPPPILGRRRGAAAAIDLFSSKNFYKDKANWLDKRYYRCNNPRSCTSMWDRSASGRSRRNRRRGANCDDDWPRERIVSPYAYKTAKEHYEALLAQAKAKGGRRCTPRRRCPTGMATTGATARPTTAPSGSGA
jgi:hypothetical protein